MAARDAVTSDAAKGAIGGAAGTVVADVTVGLERAWEAAGSALEPIFGETPPWEMAWESIVDAVGGQGAEAAGTILPYVLEMVGQGVGL